MPELNAQITMEEAYTAGFTVSRALLKRGRAYEEAVAAFQPYSEIRDPIPETRDALRALIQRSLDGRKPSYIFVNNRLEGNAPSTIEAVIEEIDLP
jgi:hypothetical protein